jgi:endonuclease V-like protein UPF0215 family
LKNLKGGKKIEGINNMYIIVSIERLSKKTSLPLIITMRREQKRNEKG